MYTVRNVSIWVLLQLAMVGFVGCSSGNYDRHDRTDSRSVIKRCLMNSDCNEAGQKCQEGFCEDIYFPRKNIKTY